MKSTSEIADGLFTIADMCMVFAVKCPEGVLLIDAGMEKGFGKARETLTAAGLDMPSHVLMTHCHCDHTEAAHLWRGLGAKIVAHKDEADRIENGTASHVPCPVDIRLCPDQQLDLLGARIGALSCPGHSPGSIAYDITISGERWLFTGDLVMLNCCPGWLGQFSLDDSVASLKKLARLPADSIATGHSFVRGKGTGLLVDSLCAAYDGTWHRHFLAHRDSFRDGKIPCAPKG